MLAMGHGILMGHSSAKHWHTMQYEILTARPAASGASVCN